MLLCNFSQVSIEPLSPPDERCRIQHTLGDLLCLSIFVSAAALLCSSSSTLPSTVRWFLFFFVIETRDVLFLPKVEGCWVDNFHLAQVLLFKLSASMAKVINYIQCADYVYYST